MSIITTSNMYNFASLLSGGDLRSIGESDKVVAIVLKNQSLFGDLFKCLYSSDSVVRMRAADAIEKVTRRHPQLLQQYKVNLVDDISRVNQKEVQWHFAELITRVNLTASDLSQVVKILEENIQASKSNIVRTFSIQAIYDLSQKYKHLTDKIHLILEKYKDDESPAVKSRVNKLRK